MVKVHKFAYTYRGFLVSIPILIALCLPYKADYNNLLLWISAGIVFSLGLFIRIWAQQHLHFRLQMKRICTTTGPYRLVRNPIYIGNTLICLAVIIASGQLFMLPVELLVCFLVFPLVVADEESILKVSFGDEYLEYLKSVPRWFPKLKPDVKPEINTDYLSISVKVELYNFLFFIPVIIKHIVKW